MRKCECTANVSKVEYICTMFMVLIHLHVNVEVRHATVKLLSLIYGRLDRRAPRVGKPISSSACSPAFYSSIVCTSTL